MLAKLIGGAAIAGAVIAVTNRLTDAAIDVGAELGGYINRSVNSVKERIGKAKPVKPAQPAKPNKSKKSSKKPNRGKAAPAAKPATSVE